MEAKYEMGGQGADPDNIEGRVVDGAVAANLIAKRLGQYVWQAFLGRVDGFPQITGEGFVVGSSSLVCICHRCESWREEMVSSRAQGEELPAGEHTRE